MREVIGRRAFWRDRCLLLFGGGRGGRLDAGVEVDDGDTTYMEVNTVVGNASLCYFLGRRVLCLQPMELIFRF